MDNPDYLTKWETVRSVLDYLRQRHPDAAGTGYDLNHPLAIAIWDWWLFYWETA